MKIILVAAIAAASAVASVSSMAAVPNSFKSGNWTVERSIHPMTDAVTCTGYLKTPQKTRVEMTENSLFIAVGGGPRAVTLRFGNEPAENLRLATQVETRTGAFQIKDQEFEKAASTSRIRASVVTFGNDGGILDMDTTGIQKALEHIRAGCPARK